MLATSVFSFPFIIVLSLHFSSRAWVPKVIQHYLYTSGSFICDFQSEVFAVAFALLAAVAVILTLNVSSPSRSICGFKKVSILWHNPLNSLMGDAFEFTFCWFSLLLFYVLQSTVIQATVYKHLIKAGSIYSISGFDVTQSNLNDSPLSIWLNRRIASPPLKYVSSDSWRLSICLWSSLYQLYDCPL